MADLEKFLHGEPVAMPVLIRAALAHAQFETIHPFLDGNGRLGRLLVTLLLCSETADGEARVLSRPLLYLSLHLKSHRDTYYERLQAIRTDGDWEGWLRFFLEGVISVADLASETTKRIVELIERDRKRISTLGRASRLCPARLRPRCQGGRPANPRNRRATAGLRTDGRHGHRPTRANRHPPRANRPPAQQDLRLRRVPEDLERGDRAAVSAAGNSPLSTATRCILERAAPTPPL